MGSANPVVVLPNAMSQRGPAIAEQIASSALLAQGQFCTSPGLVMWLHGEGAEGFAVALRERLCASNGGPTVHPTIDRATSRRSPTRRRCRSKCTAATRRPAPESARSARRCCVRNADVGGPERAAAQRDLRAGGADGRLSHRRGAAGRRRLAARPPDGDGARRWRRLPFAPAGARRAASPGGPADLQRCAHRCRGLTGDGARRALSGGVRCASRPSARRRSSAGCARPAGRTGRTTCCRPSCRTTTHAVSAASSTACSSIP